MRRFVKAMASIIPWNTQSKMMTRLVQKEEKKQVIYYNAPFSSILKTYNGKAFLK